jgi:multidrug efflux pump subunit AcrB
VALAVLAGTFATLAVFVPISVMEGIVGQFLIQYGLTIVFSVSVSLLVALTLTPMLASRFMRLEHRDHGWLGRIENFHRRMAERYAELVAWTFSHTKLVILAAAGSLVIGGIFASMVPSTFLGEGQVGVMIAAVVASVGLMMLFARSIGEFVSNHPTIKMLALSFLVVVGVVLIADGFGHHVPKGYIYFAMAFSVGVEMLNIRMRKTVVKPVDLREPYVREEKSS